MAEEITLSELERLRTMTFRHGEVFEPQLVHLKLWMLGAATHAEPKDLTIEINTDTYTCHFVLTLPKFKATKARGAKKAAKKKNALPKDFEKKCSSVGAWTQFLFGPWWSVKFSQNGKALFWIDAREKPPEDIAKKLRAVVAKDDTQDYGKQPK